MASKTILPGMKWFHDEVKSQPKSKKVWEGIDECDCMCRTGKLCKDCVEWEKNEKNGRLFE